MFEYNITNLMCDTAIKLLFFPSKNCILSQKSEFQVTLKSGGEASGKCLSPSTFPRIEHSSEISGFLGTVRGEFRYKGNARGYNTGPSKTFCTHCKTLRYCPLPNIIYQFKTVMCKQKCITQLHSENFKIKRSQRKLFALCKCNWQQNVQIVQII